MERGCMEPGENIYRRCRKEAAVYNEKLASMEKAAELLGISVSTLSNYELGVTKVIPNDIVMIMADLYKAPQLNNWYCKNECPMGKEQSLGVEIKSLERVAVNIVSNLDGAFIENMKRRLLQIAEDGQLSSDEEEKDFRTIVQALDKLAVTISELKLLEKKLLKKGSDEIGC